MAIHKEVKGQGEEVVVIHGWGCDLRHMNPIVEQLTDRYRVTNIDLPGRGQSDWQSSIHTIHDMADMLLPSLPKKATYVVWSFGGLIAMSIAARYPERVERIIGIGTTPKFIAADNWRGVPQPGFIAGFDVIKQKGFHDFFVDYYDVEFENTKPTAYQTLISMLDRYDADLDVLLQGIKICDSTDLRKEFASIQCPIDLIWGSKDDSVQTDLNQLKALNPTVKIHTIPNAHHMMFWTHPDEFNQILKKLL